MSMNDQKPDTLAEKILGKIKDEGIHPEASWKFIFRRTLLWTGIALAGLCAAVSLSIVISSLLSIDEGIFGFAPKHLFSPAVFRALPFLWIGSLLAFVTLAVFEYRETGHGYRHRPTFVILTTFLIVFAIGFILHLLQIGERSDIVLRNAIPSYDRSVSSRDDFWKHPEDGFTTGTVSEILPDGFLIESPDGSSLDVHTDEDTVVRLPAAIMTGKEVRIVGVQEPNGRIDAEEILPVKLPKERGRGNNARGFKGDQPTPDQKIKDPLESTE